MSGIRGKTCNFLRFANLQLNLLISSVHCDKTDTTSFYGLPNLCFTCNDFIFICSFLGCAAQEVSGNQEKFDKAHKTLKKIARTIVATKKIMVELTRKNILDRSSGPLYVQNMYL